MKVIVRRLPLLVPRTTVYLSALDQLVGVDVVGEVSQLIVSRDESQEHLDWRSPCEVVHVPIDVELEVADGTRIEIVGTYMQNGYRLTTVYVLGRPMNAEQVGYDTQVNYARSLEDDEDEEDDTDDDDNDEHEGDVEAVARQPRRSKKKRRQRAAAPEAKPAADDGPSLTERILTAIRGAAPVKLPGKTIAHLLQSHPGSTALRISALVRGGRLIEEQEGGMVVLCEPIAKPVATMPEVDAGMSPTSDFAPDEL